MFRKLLFIIGIILIALPLLFLFSILPLNIIPSGSFVGIDILDNNILSIAVGVLLIILAFLSWRRERRMLFGGRFMGPRGPGDTQIMRRPSEADLRRMQDVQRLRALQGAT